MANTDSTFSEVTIETVTHGMHVEDATTSGLTYIDIIKGTFLWLFFVVALIGNVLVMLFGFSRHGNGQAVSKLFVCSLAASDILTTLFITTEEALKSFGVTVDGGPVWCGFTGYLRPVIAHTQILTLTAISIERFVTVVKQNRTMITMRRAVVMVTYVWFHSLVTNSPWLAWTIYQKVGDHFRCGHGGLVDARTMIAYAVVTRMLNFFLPLVITWCCYGAILVKLWLSHNKVCGMGMGQVASHAASGGSSQVIRKVSLMCMAVVLSFTLLWTPFHVTVLFVSVGMARTAAPHMTPTFIVGLLNSCLNPIIYGVMWKPFRKVIRYYFCGGVHPSVASVDQTNNSGGQAGTGDRSGLPTAAQSTGVTGVP